MHFSTKFSTFYLTFFSEVRLLPNLKFGSFLSQLQDESSPKRGLLPSLFKSFSILAHACTSVRENLQSVHQRVKDYYLGTVERMFSLKYIVRVRLKSRAKSPNKFKSKWSAPHEAVSIKYVIIILKINLNRKIVVHHDRIFSGIKLFVYGARAYFEFSRR